MVWNRQKQLRALESLAGGPGAAWGPLLPQEDPPPRRCRAPPRLRLLLSRAPGSLGTVRKGKSRPRTSPNVPCPLSGLPTILPCRQPRSLPREPTAHGVSGWGACRPRPTARQKGGRRAAQGWCVWNPRATEFWGPLSVCHRDHSEERKNIRHSLSFESTQGRLSARPPGPCD